MRFLSVLSVILALAPSAFAAEKKIILASKIDTEGAVLGNIVNLLLIEQGFDVENKIQLGATPIVRSALINNQIDLYPEYTGNGAFFYDMAESDVWRDAQKAWQTVAEKDLAEHNLVWLKPAPANNTWAIAIRGDVAREHDIVSLDDFAKYVSEGGKVKLAGSAEFVNSAMALPAFQSAYGFTLNADQLVVLSGGNTATTIRAAAIEQDGVNTAMAYGTDGALASLDLQLLQDNKNVQPIYQPAMVVRKEVLDQYPEIQNIIENAFKGLNESTLQSLNAAVAINGVPAKTVAKSYLVEQGLIPE